MSAPRAVRITLGRVSDTKIVVDGVEQEGVTEFVVRQNAHGTADSLPTLQLTRVILPDTDDDVVIEGLADVIELFADEARRAAAEQRMAVGSFVIHESDEPELRTLGEIITDAKRYRAMRESLNETAEQAAGDVFLMDRGFRAQDQPHVEFHQMTRGLFDALSDELRARKRERRLAQTSTAGDTGQQPQPDKS